MPPEAGPVNDVMTNGNWRVTVWVTQGERESKAPGMNRALGTLLRLMYNRYLQTAPSFKWTTSDPSIFAPSIRSTVCASGSTSQRGPAGSPVTS